MKKDDKMLNKQLKNKKTAMLILLEKHLKENDKEKAKIIADKLQKFKITNYEELNNNEN